MEQIPDETEVEIAVKIIGEREEKKYFNSLADALNAFLQGEINQIIIEGEDMFCWFWSRYARIGKQSGGEFEENFIEAPIVFLKLFAYNEEMTDFPQFQSLSEGFQAFFEKRIAGLQIYEQKCNFQTELFEGYTNYMIVFDWDEIDPQKVLLHLHGDAEDNHYWRMDSRYQKHDRGDFCLLPIHAPTARS